MDFEVQPERPADSGPVGLGGGCELRGQCAGAPRALWAANIRPGDSVPQKRHTNVRTHTAAPRTRHTEIHRHMALGTHVKHNCRHTEAHKPHRKIYNPCLQHTVTQETYNTHRDSRHLPAVRPSLGRGKLFCPCCFSPAGPSHLPLGPGQAQMSLSQSNVPLCPSALASPEHTSGCMSSVPYTGPPRAQGSGGNGRQHRMSKGVLVP